jgi:hypothetical protein
LIDDPELVVHRKAVPQLDSGAITAKRLPIGVKTPSTVGVAKMECLRRRLVLPDPELVTDRKAVP